MPRVQANQAGMSRPHDIRNAIPKIDINDPAKFPQYVKREYPKMLTFVEDGKRKPVIDPVTESPYLFDSDEDVEEFLASMDDQERADNIRKNDPDAQTAVAMEQSNALLKKATDQLSAKDRRIAELEAALASGKIPHKAVAPAKNKTATPTKLPTSMPAGGKVKAKAKA